MTALVSLDGRILPAAEARIDPLDRGFLFGDALYEGIKVRRGVPLFLAAHLARLRSGLERIAIPPPDDLERQCRALLDAAAIDTGFLYLQVTRGVGPRTQLPPPGLEPTVFQLLTERTYDPPAGRRLRLATHPDLRWRHCNLKTTSLLGMVMGRLAVRAGNPDEVIFRSDAGELREGSHTNFLVVRRDRLETHPLDGRVLPGVTRGHLLELARDAGLPIDERAPRIGEREQWDEAVLCGTVTGVQPVVELDGARVGTGECGPWTRRLADGYDARERREAGEVA